MQKSISEIKQEFEIATKEKLPELFETYGQDPRAGVLGLIKRYKKNFVSPKKFK